MRRVFPLFLLCLTLTGCGDQKQDDLAEALADARAQLSVGVTEDTLGNIVAEVEKRRLLAEGGLTEYEAALTGDFVKTGQQALKAWRSDFGCEIEMGATLFVDISTCPDGRQTLVDLLSSFGLDRTAADRVLGVQVTEVQALLGAILDRLAQKAEVAAKAF